MADAVHTYECVYDAGEFGRTGAGGDQQEPGESNQSLVRRRPDADLHADAARFLSTISRLADVRLVAATVTATSIRSRVKIY